MGTAYRLEQVELRRGRNARVRTFSEEETSELGRGLARILKRGDVVALYGELGTGKTRLVQGACRELGVRQTVTSPSFTIVNEYHGRFPVYHFDFYRIERPEEIAALGTEEYFEGQGVCFIEWAERAQPFLPLPRLEVQFRLFFEAGREQEREIQFRWLGGRR